MSQTVKLKMTPKGFTLPNIPGPPADINKHERDVRGDGQRPSADEANPFKHPALKDEKKVFPRKAIDDLFDFSDEDAETLTALKELLS